MRPTAPVFVRLLCHLTLTAAALLLAACGTSPITAQQTLTGQEGAVVVKLITNSPGETDPAETLSALQLERVLAPGQTATGQDTLTLVRTRQATNSTAVFSGMLLPGRYVIKEAKGGQGNWLYTFPIDAKFGSFDVARGEVTLLGTLLIQPTAGKRFVVAYVPPEDELQKTFESLYPALAAQTRGRPVHGFIPTPELRGRTALVADAKRKAALWNGLTQTADGEFMAGAKLGKVLWRPAGQPRWRELDAGTWHEVMGARPHRGGILAFGEEGMLRLSNDEGRSWQGLTPPDEGMLSLVQPLRDGRVVALSRTDRLWSAYVSDDVTGGQWRKLGEFADTRSLNLPIQRAMMVSFPNAAGVMLANGDLHMTDGNKIVRTSNGSPTSQVSALPDGALVARTVAITMSTVISNDAGTTWRDMNVSRFAFAMAFKDSQTAYAVSAIAPGLMPGPMGLMTTRDGAKTWKHTGTSPGLTGPYAVRQMMVDRADGSLIALLPDNAIVRSVDEGRSWRLVKDN